ncbi:Zinc-specific metallo-regulatory protein [Chlamydia abortus]|uniref:Fur family transcriptional regulator n=1 Tax=Paenibacillus residui TaxID=629724 RepID=A0ABW3D9D3_9BACL|nr:MULTISPECIES: Fur family transcriptional regulator [Paenibacillaceae]SHE10892.1 Zinc-specific metallo-regulatory protein [Chlamydia abortus]
MAENQTVQTMLDAMSKKGWRITDQRRRLAELFSTTDEYLSPKDVYEYMRQKYPSVSFDTIYRNLRLLSEMGILEQFYFLDSGLKFKANCSTHHHHHLICVNCEKTVTFDYCPMWHVSGLPEQFDILNHRFEIYGICNECKTTAN